MDIKYIKSILPHREPFLFIDSIVSIDRGEQIQALRKFPSTEYFFQGHFPGSPVVPGVIIVEALAQVGGILIYESFKDDIKDMLPALAGLENVRFKRPVMPDDEVLLVVNLTKARSRLWKLSGEAKVRDSVVAQADILASVFAKQ